MVFTPAVPATPQSSRAASFIDRPEEGGLLVGLEIGIGVGNDGSAIYPRDPADFHHHRRGETQGSMHGHGGGDMITVRAREGFAVGGS